ncbi:hypothetical protein ACFLY1_00280 [Patescibacteria group bacterium]
MKKGLILLAVLVIGVFSVSNVNAQTYQARKVFSMGGEFIEYIPFPFTVPSGNCGNIQMFEYMSGSYIGGPAYWEEAFPGESIPGYSSGIFKFVVDNTQCDPEFVIQGTVFDGEVYSRWFGHEQNPEDLGILVKGIDTAENVFSLSEDDTQFSYMIIFSSYGRKYTLDELAADADSGNYGIQPSGTDLVGAIIPDKRGFLKKIFFNDGNLVKSARKLKKKRNVVINDDQVVVLIYKENY